MFVAPKIFHAIQVFFFFEYCNFSFVCGKYIFKREDRWIQPQWLLSLVASSRQNFSLINIRWCPVMYFAEKLQKFDAASLHSKNSADFKVHPLCDAITDRLCWFLCRVLASIFMTVPLHTYNSSKATSDYWANLVPVWLSVIAVLLWSLIYNSDRYFFSHLEAVVFRGRQKHIFFVSFNKYFWMHHKLK